MTGETPSHSQRELELLLFSQRDDDACGAGPHAVTLPRPIWVLFIFFPWRVIKVLFIHKRCTLFLGGRGAHRVAAAPPCERGAVLLLGLSGSPLGVTM